MNLQVVTHSPYTFLPSGILVVEPHKGLLAARTMLLAAADYYVGVSESGEFEAQEDRDDGSEVAVAVLSESLGYSSLSATAQTIRLRWPRARILIFGRLSTAIEDNLYDARIDHRARPEDLLAALEALSEQPLNKQVRPARVLMDGKTWLPIDSLKRIAESDPTKGNATASDAPFPHDMPSDEKRFRQVS